MSLRSVTFDLVTKRERNQRFMSRGGAAAGWARAATAREKSRDLLHKHFGDPPGLFYTPPGAAPSYTDPNPITVRMTRIGPGTLDSDGPDDAMKNARDGVADWLGIDDRNAGVDWPRAGQERAHPFTTTIVCKVCAAAINAPCRPGAIDLSTGKPAKMATGIHIARRTPWRVRIEVSDSAPGPDRVVVLASEPVKPKAKKRPKATPAGDPGEEVAARLLVACIICGARVREACRWASRDRHLRRVYGVHPERALAAGISIDGIPATPPPAPRTGVRKMAAKVAPAGQARLPLVRCYARLPWEQTWCTACSGIGRHSLDGESYPCGICHGSGTTGMRLAIEDRVDGLNPPGSLAYTVPEQHRARWGKTITLYRRSMTAGRLGTITVYDTKGR